MVSQPDIVVTAASKASWSDQAAANAGPDVVEHCTARAAESRRRNHVSEPARRSRGRLTVRESSSATAGSPFRL